MSWEKIKWSDFCDISPKVLLAKGAKYSFIPMDIVDGGIKHVLYPEEKIYTGGGTKFCDGDTIFARITPCLEDGKIAKIKNLKNEIGFGSTEFFVFRAKDNISDPDFVYYMAKTETIRQPAIKSMVGASGRQRADKRVVENILVQKVPLRVQRKIASILSAYDDLIENNLRRIKLLEEAAQLIYKEWFVNFKFPGYENTKFVNGLPEGWGKIQLKEIGKIITGKTPDTNNEDYFGGDVPFIRIPDMHNKVYIINTSVTLSEKGLSIQSNNTLPPNTILVSCIGSVGIVALTSCYSQTNQQINAIIPFQKEYVYFLYFYMKSIKLKLEGLGSNGATMHNVNKNKFSNILLIIPKVNTIHMFYELVINNFNKIFLLEKQVIKLMQARDLLLPKLMSGEIEV
mgnify:FL=1